MLIGFSAAAAGSAAKSMKHRANHPPTRFEFMIASS
jgi:hypothetical protein